MRNSSLVIILLLSLSFEDVRCQTNEVARCFDSIKYWAPETEKIPNASVLFENDLRKDIEAFKCTKEKYKPLVKRWAAIYLKQIQVFTPRTLYVGPITPKIDTILIFDYEGRSFWRVGNIKSLENPYAIPPSLVTDCHTFDYLLAGTFDANARAKQEVLIKWQVANCVLDGLRVDISAEDIANAEMLLIPKAKQNSKTTRAIPKGVDSDK